MNTMGEKYIVKFWLGISRGNLTCVFSGPKRFMARGYNRLVRRGGGYKIYEFGIKIFR